MLKKLIVMLCLLGFIIQPILCEVGNPPIKYPYKKESL